MRNMMRQAGELLFGEHASSPEAHPQTYPPGMTPHQLDSNGLATNGGMTGRGERCDDWGKGGKAGNL